MSDKTRLWVKRLWLPVVLLVIFSVVIAVLRPRPEQPVSAGLREVVPVSGSFARADGPRSFEFPSDYGPHEQYQTEWWYYTGSLSTAEGRRFGYQLTFFRRALIPPDETVERESAWAASQVYLAHFTISDIEGERFAYWEETARGAAGLAGATVGPFFEVWLYDWQVSQTGDETFHLSAAKEGISLELDLRDEKGPVLHGLQGYSQKGKEAGNASYYFSQTRLLSHGQITIQDQVYTVNGASWMDHEFSTSALSGEQVGWDWFSLQLDDRREILVYTIRHADGTLDTHSYGSLVMDDGSLKPLASQGFKIEVTDMWTSEKTGTQYPSGWRVTIPGEEIELIITPLLKDQELVVSYTYWEGAVEVQGSWGNLPVRGRGYAELTGYAESMQGQF